MSYPRSGSLLELRCSAAGFETLPCWVFGPGPCSNAQSPGVGVGRPGCFPRLRDWVGQGGPSCCCWRPELGARECLGGAIALGSPSSDWGGRWVQLEPLPSYPSAGSQSPPGSWRGFHCRGFSDAGSGREGKLTKPKGKGRAPHPRESVGRGLELGTGTAVRGEGH